MSLRLKLIIGLCLVFTALLIAMNVIIANSIQAGNEKIILNNLSELSSNGQIYARQFLIINSKNNDSQGFSSIAKDTVSELSSITGNPTGAYSAAGALLCSTQDEAFRSAKYDDLTYAIGGHPAYTLDTVGKQTFAYFSYPVSVAGKSVGIIRTKVDYSTLYMQGSGMMSSLTLITSIALLAALLLSILLIQSFSIPVAKLASISGTIARGIEQESLRLGGVETLLATKRNDEVGKLSKNFSNMIKKIDQQIRIIHSDKQELQRLAEYRKEFYDTVTHELKTPLTSITGYAEVLEENGFTDEAFFNKAIYNIKNESRRMYNMVVALVELSKLSSAVNYPKEVFDLGQVAAETCEGMQFKAEKYNTSIVYNGVAGARVFGSPENLKEVFINLLDNAIKYKLPQGCINMDIKTREGQVFAVVSNKANNIPEAEMSRLFEPFYQASVETRREDGSSGLGLAICKQIVEVHAGHIRMVNLPDDCVAVEVTLPFYEGL
jgi:signal transduction histidine kinase